MKKHYSKTRNAKVLINYCPVFNFRYCAKLPKNSQTFLLNSKDEFVQGAVPSTGTVISFNNYCCSLVFQPMHKHALVITITICNRILRFTSKIWKITVYKRNVDKILINLGLVVKWWSVSKCPKYAFFWIRFSIL